MSRTRRASRARCARSSASAPRSPRPTSTTRCLPTRPTPASATSTPPSAAPRSTRAASARLRGVPVAIFGAIWFACCRAAVGRRLWRAPQRPGERAGLSVRGCRRSRSPSSCISATPRSSILKAVWSAVPDHLCRRDRAVPRLRRGHFVPMTTLPRRAARISACSCRSPLAIVAGGAVPRRRGLGARVLPARGVDVDAGARRPSPVPTPADQRRRELERFMAARRRACRSSCPPRARRCWS